jgi:CheY-like chemotaxis protein
LILLDIVMPEKDGLEVLAEIKADAELQHIPVVMLSGISDEDVGQFDAKRSSFVCACYICICVYVRAACAYVYMRI